MKVNGQPFQTLWLKESDQCIIQVIDQRFLPHKFIIKDLQSVNDVFIAIKEMIVRGAPLIGVLAAYGMYLSALKAGKESFDSDLIRDANYLKSSRPTAINLAFAVDKLLSALLNTSKNENKQALALRLANGFKQFEIDNCRQIGIFGLPLIEAISKKKNGDTVNILTHCNAGWLACVDYGTATAPIYAAFDKGINIHVWVDETRPRNQGAKLTAWELGQHGVPHTIIADNTGGHLMQHGLVDFVIVGSDRTTANGDVANKIGTYLKALAAFDNKIPFYVALPSSTIDFNLTDGINQIPIEERDLEEVYYVDGLINGEIQSVLITPEKSKAANYGFDVTPARLVTGLITERGIANATTQSIAKLFPERK